MKFVTFLLLVALCVPQILSAQDIDSKTPADKSNAPAIINPPVVARRLVTSLDLKWNDKSVDRVQVNLTNDTDLDWQIYGVQSTSGLFVVSYDSAVAAHAVGKLIFSYDATENSETELESIRVKTSNGIKVIDIKAQRENAASFERKSLRWDVGESASPKSISLSLAPGTAALKKATVGGGLGHSAQVINLGEGRYRIDITPKTTEKAQEFPVFLEFSPALPGVGRVIVCTIAAKS